MVGVIVGDEDRVQLAERQVEGVDRLRGPVATIEQQELPVREDRRARLRSDGSGLPVPTSTTVIASVRNSSSEVSWRACMRTSP